MVQINFSLKEVNCKVVFYGPGLSGKTTNLEVVHAKAPAASVGDLTSIATEGDRTLFFDFLPLNLGQVAGMKTKFQIYTVPGQVYYNSTRKLVLQGADGIVFVADSKRGKMDENVESLNNLRDNLKEYGMDIATMPLVLQYNKRDLPEVYSIEEMQQGLNQWNAPYFEAVARDGTGVFPTLKKLAALVLESLNAQHAPGGGTSRSAAPSGGSGGGAAAQAQPQSSGSATAVAEPPPARSAQPAPMPMAAQAPSPVIAKKQPTAQPMAQASPMAQPAAMSQSSSSPATDSKKGGRGLVLTVGFLLVLGGAAAFLYFSGIWKNLLP